MSYFGPIVLISAVMSIFEDFVNLNIDDKSFYGHPSLERQIDAFGRENMKKQVDKLIEYAKLCEQDSSVCHRKSHVTYKKSPHMKQLQLELTRTGERIGEQLDRDKGMIYSY